MAGAVANLMVRAGADFSPLQRSMQQTQGKLSEFHNSVKRSLGIAAAATGVAVVGMGTAIAKMGIDYNAWAESSQVAWTTLLGSSTKAKQQIQDIATFAKNTQFDTAGVNSMAVSLNNAGYSGKSLFDELQRVADVSGAFNISADDAKNMTMQISQVQQATVAYTQDLNQLQNFGIPIYKAIAKELHTTVAGVRKLASEGKISSTIYMNAFNSIATTVKGASDAQSKTFNGMISTMSDDLKIISGTLMKVPFAYLKSTMDKLMPVLDRFSSTLKDKGLKTAIGEIVGKEQTAKLFEVFNTIKTQGVAAFNLLKGSVKFVIDNFNTLEPILGGVIATIGAFKVINTVIKLYETWQAVTKLMTAAQIALSIAMDANPIGVIILAVGALTAAGIYLYKNWSGISSGMSKIWNSIERGAASMVNGIVDKLNVLIRVMDKITGFKIPTIQKVSWGSSPADSLKGGNGVSGRNTSSKASLAHYALGTNYHPGGLAVVGENGRELVDLPEGSRVHTNLQTNNLPDQIASAVGTAVVQAMQFNKPSSNQSSGDINLVIDGRVIARVLKPWLDQEQKRVGTKISLQSV